TPAPAARDSSTPATARPGSSTSLRGLSFRPPVVGFAGRRTLQLGAEEDLLGQFVARDVAGSLAQDALREFFLRRVLARAQLDERDDLVAPPDTGAAGHHHVVDRGVLGDRGLDFFGEDLLAAGVNGDGIPS